MGYKLGKILYLGEECVKGLWQIGWNKHLLTPCLVWHKQEKNSFGILICGKFYVWFDIKQEKNSFPIPPNSCFGGFTIPSKMVGFDKNSFGI